MKLWSILFLLAAAAAGAEPLTLVSTLTDRPVFSVVTDGVTLTRSLAPGSRVALEAGLFSGLGEKKLPLEAGAVYYLAKVGATAGLYRLAPGQILILNQSGRPVRLAFETTTPAAAHLASGNWALADLEAGGLTVAWAETGAEAQALSLASGGVYRLVLDSPGIGTSVRLTAWD